MIVISSRSTRAFCLVFLISTFALGHTEQELASKENTFNLNTIRDIRNLKVDQADSFAQIEGVVCTRDAVEGSFFVDDGELSMYVVYPNAGALRRGQLVRIMGQVQPGYVNNILVASDVKFLNEERPLPTPISVKADELSLPEHDCAWVTLDKATVEAVVIQSCSTRLYCVQNGVRFLIVIRGNFAEGDAMELVGAEVSVTGNCGVHPVGDQIESMAIYADIGFLRITRKSERPLVQKAFTNVGNVWRSDELSQFRMKGTITYHEHFGMFIEDASGGTWLHAIRPLYNLSPGTTVEVFGYRDGSSSSGNVTLDARLVYEHRVDVLPKLTPLDIDRISDDYESYRICLEGKLVSYRAEFCRKRKCGITTLILEHDGRRFAAEVHGDVAKNESLNLSTARMLKVTGVVTFSNPVEGCEWRLCTQSFADVEVSTRSRVWSSARVAWFLALGSVGLIGCLVWGIRHRISDHRRKIQVRGLTALLRSSYDSIRDGIVIVEQDQRVLAANRKAREFFAFEIDSGQLVNASTIRFSEARHSQSFNKIWRDLNQDFSSTFETDLEINEPQARKLEVFSAPVRNGESHASARLWAFHDVTEKQRLHDNLCHAQKQEAIGRLAGGLAHDFNNLLTGITGNLFVSKVDKTKTVAEILESLEAAEGAAQRAAELVSNLLGLSQKLSLKKQRTCVNSVLRRMEPLVRPSIPKYIQLEFQLADSLPSVIADPVRLEQVLLNLCLNARDSIIQKKVDSGMIVLQTSLARDKGNGQQCVEITIRDSGCGINRDLLPYVFEPFYTTKGSNGTGLGLSMSLGIVQQHSGTIEVASKIGVGSTFVVSLPALAPEQQTATTPVTRSFGR